jgi:hypothetical protein
MVKKRKFGMANSIMIKRKLLKKVLAEQAKEFFELKKLNYCIQYSDDTEKGNTVTCKRLDFKNFHDYKKYKPSVCNKDMVNFFVKGVGSKNKGKYTEQIINRMNNGTCDSPYVFNKKDSTKPIETGGEIFLKKQQKLVPRLINPQTNLKGLLVYHGLGSGKTGTSIIVGEACKHIMTNGNSITNNSGRSQTKVLVVVPAALKEQYKQEILGNLIHKKSTTNKDEIKRIIKKKIDTINQSLLRTCFKIKGNANNINNSFSKNVLINDEPQKYTNTVREVNFIEKQLSQQTNNLLFNKVNRAYKVVSRQTFMKHFLFSNEIFDKDEAEVSIQTGTGYCIKRFLTQPNGLLIIDEIQNLISETGSWYKNLIRGIKYYCHPTTKILLLTATPIYDKIFEIGLTLNLLNPRIRFPETRVEFDKLFVATSADELNDEENRKNSKDIKERKSVFSTEEKRIETYTSMLPDKEDLTPKQIKDRFKTIERCYYELIEFLGEVINENQMFSIEHFTPELKKIIKLSGGDTNMSDFSTLLNLAEILKKQLGLNEYRNSVIKNKDLFEYMCSGYISYFKGGNPKGFPRKITKIIDCRMSNVQANAYIGIVKMEVKKNRNAEASRQLNPNSIQQGTYFQKATMASNVHLIRKVEGNNQEKIRKELIDKILQSPKIIKAQENKEELFEEIKLMTLFELRFLDEEINIDTVHHSQNEEELQKDEEELIKNIENIYKKSNKNKLRIMLEERKRMTKAYYEATLKGIKFELRKISNLNEKLQLVHNKYSCKFARMIYNIINPENGEGKHFIYSRFKTRGVECLSYMLEGFGYKRYTEETILELKEMMESDVIPEEDCFVVWSGDIMNKSDFSKNFKSIYNHRKNRNGDYLKIVLGTESIMEGVNLKEVKYVHITEPWWNESRMDQVMGRAIRWKSHINMPEKEQQVIIYRYYAITSLAPKDFAPEIQPLASSTLQTRMVEDQVANLNKNQFERDQIRENIDWEMHKLKNPEPISPLAFSSIDRYIQGVAEKKKRLNQMFYKSVKNSAIDCLFNKFGNTYRLEKEFYYDENKLTLEYFYDPTEHKYYSTTGKELSKEIYGNIVEIKEKEKGKITLKKVDNNKGIYYENIDCNSSEETGRVFEDFLGKNNFYHLLNTEHHNKIKEIIFNIYNEKTSDTRINEIKMKLKRCLEEKINNNNPEENKDILYEIFNSSDKKSPKEKAIEQIVSIIRKYKFDKQFEEEFDSNMSAKEEERLINIIKARVEESVKELKSKLFEQSWEYIKKQHANLRIGERADKVYKDMIKRINGISTGTKKSGRRGGRRGGRQRPVPRFNPNSRSM